MYEKLPNLVIGFHGCSLEVYEKVIHHQEDLKGSENDYDWLGHGIYFWENNLERAREWAVRRYHDGARVVGAVIDLGYCLNLTDSASENYLRQGYELLKARCAAAGRPLPKNRKSKMTDDILLRDLDCAVIQQIQDFHVDDSDASNSAGTNMSHQTTFDTVRGVFLEGEPPYDGSAFRSKTHIQICVCNPNCIKGYFDPRSQDPAFRLP